MRKRKKEIDIDALIALDAKRRELIYTAEQKKAEQNQKNKLVPQYKKEGRDVTALFAEMKALAAEVKEEQMCIRDSRCRPRRCCR